MDPNAFLLSVMLSGYMGQIRKFTQEAEDRPLCYVPKSLQAQFSVSPLDYSRCAEMPY